MAGIGKRRVLRRRNVGIGRQVVIVERGNGGVIGGGVVWLFGIVTVTFLEKRWSCNVERSQMTRECLDGGFFMSVLHRY